MRSKERSQTTLGGAQVPGSKRHMGGLSSPRANRSWFYACITLLIITLAGPWVPVYKYFGLHSSILLFTPTDQIRGGHDGRNNNTYVSQDAWTEWHDIEPSEKLQWQPCFGVYGMDLHCARLTVAMDHERPLNESIDHPRVHLALVLVPGSNRTLSDPSSYAATPVLVNPGGPGGSGTVFAELNAATLQRFLGAQNDVVGFDPRGVGFSTPKADCFASNLGREAALVNRVSWSATGQNIGLTNSSSVAMSKLEFRERALNKLCKRVDVLEGHASIFRYVSTPYAARDLVSIVDAWDEWRSGGVESKHTSRDESGAGDSDDHPGDDDKKESLKGKVVYWGFSYGTYLGATFASLFPDRVGRVVLDGVIQPENYVSPMWMDSVLDADKVFSRFFEYCVEAGSLCALYNPGDQPGDIRKRFDTLMARLEIEPTIQLSPGVNSIDTISASDLKKVVFFYGLYAPRTGFPTIAALIRDLENDSPHGWVTTPPLAALCGHPPLILWPDDANRAIACTDKAEMLSGDPEDLQARFEYLASTSWFGDVWFGVFSNLGCSGWDIKSKEPPLRWGDYSAHNPTPIKTDFPILILSNSLDPVTPLRHAVNMTRVFANASIVEQDGVGHCTLSCVSTCTMMHLRAYINEGVVPPPPTSNSSGSAGTGEGDWPKCTCDEQPWIRPSPETSALEGQVSPDVLQAYRDLGSGFASFTLDQHLDYHNPLKGKMQEFASMPHEEFLENLASL